MKSPQRTAPARGRSPALDFVFVLSFLASAYYFERYLSALLGISLLFRNELWETFFLAGVAYERRRRG